MICAHEFFHEYFFKRANNQALAPPGLAICVIDGDAHSFYYHGVRALDDKKSIDATNKWHLGSCGKSMTACMLFDLAAENLIDVHDSIGSILSRSTLPKKLHNVTLLQLLGHVSRLRNELTPAIAGILSNTALDGKESRRRFTDVVLSDESLWSDEKNFAYSNWGYVIIGHIIDTICGDYENALQEKIFRPLGMNSAGFGAPLATHGKNQPKGHCYHESTMYIIDPCGVSDNHRCLSPAGRMHCTIADWARYIQMIITKWHKDGGTDNLFFQSPESSNYIYAGFIFEQEHKAPRLIHYGSNTFWFASASIYPHAHRALLIASNWGGINKTCWVNEELQEDFLRLNKKSTTFF